jgi:hypothetical protein
MNIFKLTYNDKDQAVADLVAKNILVFEEEGCLFGEGVKAVVEVGLIILAQPTFDEEGNELTPVILADGYHYDIMSTEIYDFGANLVEPKNPKHAFAGYPITAEYIPTEEELI